MCCGKQAILQAFSGCSPVEAAALFASQMPVTRAVISSNARNLLLLLLPYNFKSRFFSHCGLVRHDRKNIAPFYEKIPALVRLTRHFLPESLAKYGVSVFFAAWQRRNRLAIAYVTCLMGISFFRDFTLRTAPTA